MQVLHYLPAGVPVNAAACLWAEEQGAGGWRWQFSRFMHPRRGPGREKRPFLATYRRHASKTSWLWQDMRAMYPKSPANRLSGMHSAQILPGRALFAARTLRIMHTAQILPSVAAEQRERSQARRRPYGAAACLWAEEQGAGGFLSGGVGRCRRSAWRCGVIER